MLQKFRDYQPTKGTLVWTGVGVAVATMILGFTIGGWVTGGSAKSMVEDASETAREQLVASICVNKFVSEADAAGNLAALKEASSYEQDNFIEDGGWSTIAALEEQISGSADLCAERLVGMEGLPAGDGGAPGAPGEKTTG